MDIEAPPQGGGAEEPKLMGEGSPESLTKEDVLAWVEWAKLEATVRLEAEDAFPRIKVMDEELGTLVPVPLPMRCSAADLMSTMGVGVRLYFDVIKFWFGFCILGALFHLPSFYASISELYAGAYAQDSLSDYLTAMPFPTVFAIMTLGARATEANPAYGFHLGCTTATCKFLNTLNAGLDILYCLLLFYGVRSFQDYAEKLAVMEDEENATIEDYSIMLYGLSGLRSVEPEQIKAHVEAALKEHAEVQKAEWERRLSRAMQRRAQLTRLGKYFQAQKLKWNAFLEDKSYTVADVTIIADDRGLLRELMELAPLEEKVPSLKLKLAIAEKMQAGCCTIPLLKRNLRLAERSLHRERAKVDKQALKSLRPVGAFVTFEMERTQSVACKLWKPGLWAQLFQPKYAQFAVKAKNRDGELRKKLRGYVAPRPQDVRYENMPIKFAYRTKARRCCGTTLLTIIVIVGMIFVLVGVVLKRESQTLLEVVAAETGLNEGRRLQTIDAANATSTSFFECTLDQQQLIDGATDNLIGTMIDLANQVRRGSLNEESNLLLVALLRCYATQLAAIVSSVLVVVVNLLIKLSIDGLLNFSRYPTLTERHLGQVWGLFVAQFLNTAIIMFIVQHASGQTEAEVRFAAPLCLDGVLPEQFKCVYGPRGVLLRGIHLELSPNWYVDVGATLCFTLIIEIIVRYGVQVLKVWIQRCTLNASAKKIRNVQAMKKLLTGKEPELPVFLGKMYTFMAVVLLFSTPMPVLYIFGAVYCVLQYCIDKWYLLRVCRKPIPYNEKFVRDTLSWVQWVMLLKLVIALRAYKVLPGIMINEAIEAARQAAVGVGQQAGTSTNAAASSTADLAAQWFARNANSGTIVSFILQHTMTVGSLILTIGTVIIIFLVLLHIVFYHSHSTLIIFDVISSLFKKDDASWPPENPPFSKVTRSPAASERVRVVKEADETGRGEVLAVASDVSADCCHRMGPLKLLLYCFGIQTFRTRVKNFKVFNGLPFKMNYITGKANMSYAPHFMPLYEPAFRYAEEHERAEEPRGPEDKYRVNYDEKSATSEEE